MLTEKVFWDQKVACWFFHRLSWSQVVLGMSGFIFAWAVAGIATVAVLLNRGF